MEVAYIRERKMEERRRIISIVVKESFIARSLGAWKNIRHIKNLNVYVSGELNSGHY
jgi:hypothetical protein